MGAYFRIDQSMTVNNAGNLETRLKNVIWSLVSGLFFTAVDEVPTQAPDFGLSLSVASDSDLTANLIDALRAARVEAQCPSEAAVRAFNGAEG